MKKTLLTYISLFSSAGVGCYGFKMEGFECVATNELIARRINVQKFNNKCRFDSGYIAGDITDPIVKKRLFDEIAMWKRKRLMNDVDVVIATPPCQGMSVANQKKTDSEIVRNSLIVESIKIISDIRPKVFVFENVPLFMRTLCTDTDGIERPISDAINRNLGEKYSIYSQVLNFKDYGACSSRSRTLVIAVRRDLADFFSPVELFPRVRPEITLRQCIGAMPALKTMGEIDESDILHSFRPYPEHMRAWISELYEGQSAFDNKDEARVPHQIIDGRIIINQRKNGDKYRRQVWDKVGPCVHTRNDQLASQNTIHPADDRVFSIRELMMMMSVPDSFCWTGIPPAKQNLLSGDEKHMLLKKHEANIRQSLGEAVPTEIFRSIAASIAEMLGKNYLKDSDVLAEIESGMLSDTEKLSAYIRSNPRNLGFASLCRLAELANSKRNEHEGYFTNKSLITEIIKPIPDNGKDCVRILEPSVGAGSFLPFIIKMFEKKREVLITAMDINADNINILKELVKHIPLPDNVHIEFLCGDFLLSRGFGRYDLVIGNPPFSKSARGKHLEKYRVNSLNKRAVNTSAFFLEKALSLGRYVAMIMPKFLLNTTEFETTRELLSEKQMNAIIDFGERGFDGVLIETIALCVNTEGLPGQTSVISVTENECRISEQNYICDKRLPYWLIYRDEDFDNLYNKMRFDVFNVFRDRQLTNSIMDKDPAGIRVIKSRNICDDGSCIVDIDGYDAYVSKDAAENLSVYRYISNDSVYLTPNMTYNPRVIKKPKGVLVNGSAAILTLKDAEPPLSEKEVNFFASEEYRRFYRTARNRQTRSLNVDANSVFFFGRDKNNIMYKLVKWIKAEDISHFLKKQNYDLRLSGNNRWIDHRCSADVVAAAADCILRFVEKHPGDYFTPLDIRNNEYTVEYIEPIFNKPGRGARDEYSEYEKLFLQTMEMLSYAGVLKKQKRGFRSFYIIARAEIMEFISVCGQNALTFLQLYISKVLADSGLAPIFENFFKKQTQESYEVLKTGFSDFTTKYTKIKSRTECDRVFIKVLNPLAYMKNSLGTDKGHISKHIITYDMLMNNRDALHGYSPEKSTTGGSGQAASKQAAALSAYLSQKAKRIVRDFNDSYRSGLTELDDKKGKKDKADCIYEIFSEAEFPELCGYYENLIVLTAGQQRYYAGEISAVTGAPGEFRRTLLLAKANIIRERMEDTHSEQLYSFDRFMHVLSVGLNNYMFKKIDRNDFDRVIAEITASG